MKVTKFNGVSYGRNDDSTVKPPLIKGFNLAVMTAAGAVNGIYRIKSSQSLLNPLDKNFYDFITSSKSAKWNSIAKKFKNWLSPEDVKIFPVGSKIGVNGMRMLKGAALLASIYLVPKLIIGSITGKKNKSDSDIRFA